MPGPVQVGEWKVPGARDSDLTVDHFYLPPLEKKETLFVVTSGIHGSESYAGSACMEMLFEEILPKADRRNVGLFFVHAMNPFGFRYHRRCTETHVNLNRNFSVSGDVYALQNPMSKLYCERFLRREPVSSPRSYLLESMSTIDGQVWFGGGLDRVSESLVEMVSLDALVKATAPGQFENPAYFEYGGREPEPQTRLFIEAMREIMPDYRDVVGLDLHTGLGHRGRLHLLTGGAESAADKTLIAELFRSDEDRAFYEFTASDAEGFYEVHGCLNNVFGDLRRPGQRVCGLTLEYGTLGHSLEAQIDGLNRFVLDLQGLFHGFKSSELAKKVDAEQFERSYPDDDQWRRDVIAAARGLFTNVLRRSAAR